MRYLRKVLLKNQIQVIDTDNDGLGDSVIYLPKNPVNIQFTLTEDIQNLGLYAEYSEVEEEIDLNGIWNTGNNGSGDGGTGYTISTGVNQNNGDGTTTNTGCSTSTNGCTDPLADNYTVGATKDDGSCSYNGVVGGQGGIGGGAGSVIPTKPTPSPNNLDATNTVCMERYPTLKISDGTRISFGVFNGDVTLNGDAYVTHLSCGFFNCKIKFKLNGNNPPSLNSPGINTYTTYSIPISSVRSILNDARNFMNYDAIWTTTTDPSKRTHLSYATWVMASNSSWGPSRIIDKTNSLGSKIRASAEFECNNFFKSTGGAVINSCPETGSDGAPALSTYPTNCTMCASLPYNLHGDKSDIMPMSGLDEQKLSSYKDPFNANTPTFRSGEINSCSGTYNTKKTTCNGSPTEWSNNGSIRPSATPPQFGWQKCGCASNNSVATTVNGVVTYNTISNFFGGLRFVENYNGSNISGGLGTFSPTTTINVIDNDDNDVPFAYKIGFMCAKTS